MTKKKVNKVEIKEKDYPDYGDFIRAKREKELKK